MRSSEVVADPAWSGPQDRPGEDHRVAVRPLDGILLVVWSIVGQVLVVLGVALAGVRAPSGPSLVAIQLLAQSVVLCGALAWFAGRGRLSWRLAGSAPPTMRRALVGVAVGVLGVLVTAGVILVAQLLTDLAPAEQQLLTEAVSGGVTTALAVVSAVVLAPIIEELIFRGVLFQALGRRLGMWPGAVLSGLVFGSVHLELELAYVVALSVLGTLLAVAFHRYRSLVVPIVAHATFNAVQLALALSVTA